MIPSPETELEYLDPFELLVAVILSAQCTDERVNMVTPSLFEAFPNVEAMSEAEPEQIFPFVRIGTVVNPTPGANQSFKWHPENGTFTEAIGATSSFLTRTNTDLFAAALDGAQPADGTRGLFFRFSNRWWLTASRCRKCGYILRGLTEPRCPECGTDL